MNTQTLQIKDLGKVITGKTPSTSNSSFFDGQFPFVTPSDITFDNYYCRKTETTVTEAAKQKNRNQFIPPDSVLVTCIGSTIGKCALSFEECLTNQQINSIVPFDAYDPKYVYYLMIYNIEKIRGIGLSGGVAAPIINKTSFEKIKIKVLPKNSRDKIGDVLSSYDDLIDTNCRRILLLEESARLLFREWFVYFKFPGYEKAKIIDHGGRKIPAEWEYLPFTKIKLFKKAPLGVPVFMDTRQYCQTSEIDGTSITGSGEEVNYESRPSRADIAPRINTVYFAKMKDTDKVLYFNKGNSDLLEKILLSTGMVGFTTEEKYLGFLFGLLTSYEFVQYKNNFATGATQVSLNDASLKKIKVLLPTLNLVELYSEIVNPLLEECSLLRSQNQKLTHVRDLLLPRLMSGAIEV